MAGQSVFSVDPEGPGKYAGNTYAGAAPNFICHGGNRATFELRSGGTLLRICGTGSDPMWGCTEAQRVGAPPVTSPPPDTSPPEVRATPKELTKKGTALRLAFSVKDDSGRATAQATLYQGGAPLRTWTKKSGIATGPGWWWEPDLPSTVKGPLYFCVWAADAAGNESPDYHSTAEVEFAGQRGSCAWISYEVPIERVSNGCGGGEWDVLVWAQNHFGNVHKVFNSPWPGARAYIVNFKDACDLHDAGYGGHTVADEINGRTIDYRTWTRHEVDVKFRDDMRLLCEREIPASAPTALAYCKGNGGNMLELSAVGATTLYNFVDKQGFRFFDKNLTKPGVQQGGKGIHRFDKK
jgi:hypothetical protein